MEAVSQFVICPVDSESVNQLVYWLGLLIQLVR